MADLLVVFGGFRGSISIDDVPVFSFQKILGNDLVTHIDEYEESEDSLPKRLKTVIRFWSRESHSVNTLHVLAFSMGCHLAACFIDYVISSSQPVPIGHVLLVAVDPKFRPGAQDTHERALGIPSAFDEASQLWEDIDGPGMAFLETLKMISGEAASIRIVLCDSDGIAVRNNNVDHLVDACSNNNEIRLVEAKDGQHISAFNVSVDLSENSSETSDLEVHFRLWPAVSVGS